MNSGDIFDSTANTVHNVHAIGDSIVRLTVYKREKKGSVNNK